MSQTLLHIDASARSGDSDSRQLSAALLSRWRARHPDSRVLARDIVSQPLPHLDQTLFAAMMTAPEQHSPQQAEAAARVNALTDEFLAADVIVLGVPMYNFGIPSTLKAWIDHIVTPNRTFRYTAEGPVGMAGGRAVYVVSTRGGVHGEGPQDHQVAHLRTVFGFLGIDDVRVIQAEGLDLSAEHREQALAAAMADIERQFEVAEVA